MSSEMIKLKCQLSYVKFSVMQATGIDQQHVELSWYLHLYDISRVSTDSIYQQTGSENLIVIIFNQRLHQKTFALTENKLKSFSALISKTNVYAKKNINKNLSPKKQTT